MKKILFAAQNFGKICELLAGEQVLLFPSDTSYGFSASPFSEKAIQNIQQIKKRPAEKPFLLLVKSLETAKKYAFLSPKLRTFAAERWSKQKTPTTILAPKKNSLQNFFPNFKTVGLRVPAWPLLQQFLAEWGQPLISTSANISGEEPLFTEKEGEKQFLKEKIYFINCNDLSQKPQSEIWKEENTKLVRVR